MTSNALPLFDVKINAVTPGTPGPLPSVPSSPAEIQGGTPETPVTLDSIVATVDCEHGSISSASASHDYLANDIWLVRQWLKVIGEEDAVEVARIEQACRESREIRDVIVRLAHGVVRPAPRQPDERRYCSDCANLTNDWCAAAFRRELNAARWYQPPRDVLIRCECFISCTTPTPTPSDQSS